MMPFDAPAPRPRCGRRAEDREEIALRIAHHRVPPTRIVGAARRFEGAEYGFEIHDRRRCQVALLTEARLEQLAGQLTLSLGHRLDRQPLARKLAGRAGMPVC